MRCEDDHEWRVVKHLEEGIIAYFKVLTLHLSGETEKNPQKLKSGLLNLVFKLWFILLNALTFLNNHSS
jgi:hypothetical protein